MKVYISADIEGVTGVTIWEETERGGIGYEKACAQMTAEVAAACRGAFAAGADEIVVKDAHDSALNLDPNGLPKGVKLIRGWTKSVESMMALIDETYDITFFTGYHSEGGSNANPLAHTMTYSEMMTTKINGSRVSEMDINAWIAAQYGVPVGLVTGDKGLCDKAEKVLPGVVTVAVKDGVGEATVNLHPADAVELIDAKAKMAVENAKKGELRCIGIPQKLELELTFKEHMSACRASNYPGAVLKNEHTVVYEASSYADLLTAYSFMR